MSHLQCHERTGDCGALSGGLGRPLFLPYPWGFLTASLLRIGPMCSRRQWPTCLYLQVLPTVCQLFLLWWNSDGLLLHSGPERRAFADSQQIPPVYFLYSLPDRYALSSSHLPVPILFLYVCEVGAEHVFSEWMWSFDDVHSDRAGKESPDSALHEL